MAPLGRNQTIWYVHFQVPAAAEFEPIIKAFLRAWYVPSRFKKPTAKYHVCFLSTKTSFVGIVLKGSPFGMGVICGLI